ncbi:MAG: O-antigen ligase family protein [Actinomycetota bacterium]
MGARGDALAERAPISISGIDQPAALGLFALLIFGVIKQGGFYPLPAWILATVAVATAVFALRASAGSIERQPIIAAALLLIGLAVSTVVNGVAVWTVYATLIASFGALIATTALSRDQQRLVLQGMTVAGVLGAGTGIAGVLLHKFPLAIHQFHMWRASATLTYPNAAALLFTLSLGAALLIARESPRSVIAKVSPWLLATATVLTFSRGAVIALVVALIVLIALGGGSIMRLLIRPAIATLVTMVGLVPSVTHDARHPLPGIIGLALGLAIVLAPPIRSRYVKIAAIVVGVAVLAIASLPLSHKVGRIFDSRIRPSTGDRAIVWSLAAHELPGHWLVGRGLGKMNASFIFHGRLVDFKFAHDEALQVLVDTGVVGLACVVIAGVLLAAWAFRRRPPAQTEDRVRWAVAMSCCAAFVAHGAFDFVWHLPILVVAAFIWLGIAVNINPVSSQRESSGDSSMVFRSTLGEGA